MKVHLVDGTYELFRHHFGVPSHVTASGMEVAAMRGVLRSVLGMLDDGVTHIGVATDHVVESFRNDMWPGYKTSEGMEPVLLAQFHPLEDALRAMGVTVFAMSDWEADDALASAAAVADADERVEQVIICTPDKDLAQCVSGSRVVQMDRRKREVRDLDGVIARFGVRPESIPDYLALVGDSADGFPGLKGFGAKTAAALLARWGHLEDIPAKASDWAIPMRGAAGLQATLEAEMHLALLFRDLATLRTEPPVIASVDDLLWTGPVPTFEGVAAALEDADLASRAQRLAARRSGQ